MKCVGRGMSVVEEAERHCQELEYGNCSDQGMRQSPGGSWSSTPNESASRPNSAAEGVSPREDRT